MLPSFLITAFIASLILAFAGGLLSPFVVLRRASFASEAFAHIAFAGMACALLFDLPYILVTLLFVALAAWCIGRVSARFVIAEVNLTTIFLAASMALGVFFLSQKKGYVPDLADFLFGNILLVADSDLWLLGALALINIFWLIFFARSLYYVSYNEEVAAVYRIPARAVSTGFLMLLACNVVIMAKLAGVIMVAAGLVLPGTTALLVSRSIRAAHGISLITSLLAAVLGFYLSLAADVPVSVAVVLILFGVFLCALVFHAVRKARRKT